jgi:electron transport complex protein RnfB
MAAGPLVDALLDVLPQTQCTRCGYADCRGYAEAMASDGAAINRCPPGGQAGIERLAEVSGRPAQPLDPSCGSEGPRALAIIDEAWCIGCALCLKACPVDAIVGAAKRMHTVIDELCTGCELCVPVCPVDCIALVPITGSRSGWDAWSDSAAATARARYGVHAARVERTATAANAQTASAMPTRDPVAAAIARARQARAQR